MALVVNHISYYYVYVGLLLDSLYIPLVYLCIHMLVLHFFRFLIGLPGWKSNSSLHFVLFFMDKVWKTFSVNGRQQIFKALQTIFFIATI